MCPRLEDFDAILELLNTLESLMGEGLYLGNKKGKFLAKE